MAFVKIPIVVKGGLRDTLKYVANDAKTTLHEDGTGVRLVTGIDCSSDPGKAYQDFCRTRLRFGHPPRLVIKREPDTITFFLFHREKERRNKSIRLP